MSSKTPPPQAVFSLVRQGWVAARQFGNGLLVAAATCFCSLAAAQAKPDLTTLAGFTIGQSCAAPSGRQWITDQTNGEVESRAVPEGGGFYRNDYYHASADRRLTVNTSCTPDGLVWRITFYLVATADGERREAAVDRAFVRFGKPILYTDFWADPGYRAATRKQGKTGSFITAFWSSEPAPWKGTVITTKSKHLCDDQPESLRGICVVSQSMKEEKAHLAQLGGVLTRVEFLFDERGGREVVKSQSIEMTDVAIRATKEQAAGAEQRTLQEQQDKRASQRAPKY